MRHLYCTFMCVGLFFVPLITSISKPLYVVFFSWRNIYTGRLINAKEPGQKNVSFWITYKVQKLYLYIVCINLIVVVSPRFGARAEWIDDTPCLLPTDHQHNL